MALSYLTIIVIMGEVIKALERRKQEDFEKKYIHLPGIDIGCGEEPIHPDFVKYDIIYNNNFDATFVREYDDNTFNSVFCSHIMEHLIDPVTAVKNWYRILKPGGFLIIDIPHRDLYEKRKTLPSRWNGDHKAFYLPFTSEPPCTFSFLDVLLKAVPASAIEQIRILNHGWNGISSDVHSEGEFSIEAIIKKLPSGYVE